MLAFSTRLAAVILLLASVGVAADDAKSKPDAEAIRGKWKASSLESDGQKVPMDKEIVVEFDADTAAHVKDGEKVDPSTYTLASDKDPKEIEFKPKSGDDAGKTMKGIYELKENTLRICFAKAEGERPKEFKSADGVILVAFDRVKAEEKK